MSGSQARRGTNPVGLGCWQLGGNWAPVDDADAIRMVRTAFDLGADVFDTALDYGRGRSEVLLRRGLGIERSNVTIVSKVPPQDDNWTPKAGDEWLPSFSGEWVRECARQTLLNLGRESVDALLLHTWGQHWDVDAIAPLVQLREEGVAHAVGISTLDFAWRLPADVLSAIDVWEVNVSVTHQEPLEELRGRVHPRVIARCPFSSGALVSDWSARDVAASGDWRVDWVDDSWWATQKRNSIEFGDVCERYGVSRVAAALAFPLVIANAEVVVAGATSEAQVRENLTADWRSVPVSLLEELRTMWEANRLVGVFNGAG